MKRVPSRRLLLAAALLVFAASLAWLSSPLVAHAEDADGTSRRRAATSSLSSRLAVFGALFVEELALMPEVAARSAVAWHIAEHRLRASVEYAFEPFELRTFNFDDADGSSSARLVQWAHAVELGFRWRFDFSDNVELVVQTGGDARLRESGDENRLEASMRSSLRVGLLRRPHAPYVMPSLVVARIQYPNYRVADRTLDQRLLGGAFEAGYEFGRAGGVSIEYSLRENAYLDARYDALASDGGLLRATQSKSYLRHGLELRGDLEASRRLDVEIVSSLERNNSRHYDRLVTGLAADGSDDRRLYTDYFDYWSQRIGASVEMRIANQLLGGVRVGHEWRRFDTYEARDADNFWLGETRRDQTWTASATFSAPIVSGDEWELRLVAAGATRIERSNMKRNVSFDTNFNVTSLRLGLELSD